MSSHHIPVKPLQRPGNRSSMFTITEAPVRIVGETPIQRQRRLDGSQHTITGAVCDAPPQPELYLDGISKSMPTDDLEGKETLEKEEKSLEKAYHQAQSVVKAFMGL